MLPCSTLSADSRHLAEFYQPNAPTVSVLRFALQDANDADECRYCIDPGEYVSVRVLRDPCVNSMNTSETTAVTRKFTS
jgi:hypothetical protein